MTASMTCFYPDVTASNSLACPQHIQQVKCTAMLQSIYFLNGMMCFDTEICIFLPAVLAALLYNKPLRVNEYAWFL